MQAGARDPSLRHRRLINWLLLWTASTVGQVAGLLLDEPIPQFLAQVHETIVEDGSVGIYYVRSGSPRTEPGGRGLCAPAVLVRRSDLAIDREVVFESVETI
jgi:hypothetical protein